MIISSAQGCFAPRQEGADLLLLHELRIRAVVHDVLAEDGRGQRRVDLLGVDILQLAIEDQIVALRTQTHRGLLAQQDEGKHIAVLLATGEEELVRVDAVGNGAADEREQVEDEWWLSRIADEELAEDVEKDDASYHRRGEEENAGPGGCDSGEAAGEVVEDAHRSREAERKSVLGRVEEEGFYFMTLEITLQWLSACVILVRLFVHLSTQNRSTFLTFPTRFIRPGPLAPGTVTSVGLARGSIYT